MKKYALFCSAQKEGMTYRILEIFSDPSKESPVYVLTSGNHLGMTIEKRLVIDTGSEEYLEEKYPEYFI